MFHVWIEEDFSQIVLKRAICQITRLYVVLRDRLPESQSVAREILNKIPYRWISINWCTDKHVVVILFKYRLIRLLNWLVEKSDVGGTFIIVKPFCKMVFYLEVSSNRFSTWYLLNFIFNVNVHYFILFSIIKFWW